MILCSGIYYGEAVVFPRTFCSIYACYAWDMDLRHFQSWCFPHCNKSYLLFGYWRKKINIWYWCLPNLSFTHLHIQRFDEISGSFSVLFEMHNCVYKSCLNYVTFQSLSQLPKTLFANGRNNMRKTASGGFRYFVDIVFKPLLQCW